MTQDSNLPAYNITVLIIIILFIIVGIIYLVRQNNKKFGIWFDEVLNLAPAYGFGVEDIDKFQEIFFWDYYCEDMTPQEAIENYIKHQL